MSDITAPPAPRDLDAEDAARWLEIADSLIADGLWRDTDCEALERYVRTSAMVREARRQFAESGGNFVIVGARGQLVRHPTAALITTLERQAADLGARLMLEPQARSRGRVKQDRPVTFAQGVADWDAALADDDDL